jgi:hypothetical protein
MPRLVEAVAQDAPEIDTLVRCRDCGQSARVSFKLAAQSGWPHCHGVTMRIVDTRADVDQIVADLTAPVRLVMKRYRQTIEAFRP